MRGFRRGSWSPGSSGTRSVGMVEFFDQYAELMGQVAESAGRLQARLRENSEQMAALYQ